MRTASRLNSSLCVAAISSLFLGEHRSQKTGTKPGQVHKEEPKGWEGRYEVVGKTDDKEAVTNPRKADDKK